MHSNSGSLTRRLSFAALGLLGCIASFGVLAIMLEVMAIYAPMSILNIFAQVAKPVTNAEVLPLPLMLEFKSQQWLHVTNQIWPLWGVPLFGCMFSLTFAGYLFRSSSRYSEQQAIISMQHKLEHEISQRVSAERHLQSVDESLIEAHAGSRDIFLMLDPRLNVVNANDGAEMLFKSLDPSIETIHHLTIDQLLPDFNSTPLSAALQACFAREKTWEGEVNLEAENMWLLARVFPASKGNAFVYMRDITSLKKPEDLKQVGETVMAQLSALMPLGIAVVNTNWEYLYASKGWRKQFNLENAKLTGNSHKEVFPTFPGRYEELERKLKKNRSVSGTEDHFSLNGNDEHINWEAHPWMAPHGGLGGYIIMAEIVTEHMADRSRQQLKRQQEKHLAYHDTLTGLTNRQGFNDALNDSLSSAYRQLGQVAVMFLDLDGFKAVNDTLGHDVGDILLKEVSGRLQQIVRKSDIVSRLGGDEFTVILNGVDNETNVAKVAQKTVEEISMPYRIAGNDVRVTTSVGIGMYPAHAGSATDLIKAADSAMYRAKKSGKNQFFFFDPDLDGNN